jgi:hypothetical protein
METVLHLIRQLLAKLKPAPKPTALVHVPALRTGTWMQVVQGPNRGGYVVHCDCGIDYEFGASEALRTEGRSCACCKRELNLLRSLDALEPSGSLKADLAERLSSLTIKPFAQPTQHRPFATVGDWSVSDSGQWDGRLPLGSDGKWI